uniref:NADH dehydrogenase subunit 4L n=1 Tax=Trichuris ovis TaxID=93034 RepID=J3S807_9BILA|nr:NADH dehydrogenase subunit 4L [Trichuris ovis]AFK81051.1 NADH dehydrogenase subunit 4L [Trichuris ovis]
MLFYSLGFILFISALIKMLFKSYHLLTMFIALELISLSLIYMTWSSLWPQTMWFMTVSVIHSILGMLMLLLVMRQMGNDKNINLM